MAPASHCRTPIQRRPTPPRHPVRLVPAAAVSARGRQVSAGQRGAGGAHVDEVDGAVSLFNQPGPAGTEVADGAGLKGFLEFVVAAPLGVDGVSLRA